MKRIELLSPAGDLERLKITLLYGADAVYIGGQDYSLRANANNFSIEEIREACDFAHSLNKKVYLTLNIVFHNDDLEGVEDYIKSVYEAGIDAFIVSDPFIVSYIKDNFSDVEVHLSTQASCSNIESVKFYQSLGIDRVVLARELNKKQISDVILETGVDTEIFIHGAMCTFYSGRCVLSNYVTNRDSNRGGCAQVCRFAFDTGNDSKFTMATKDLNMAYYIKDMIDIGVKSLKVEGRMRSLYYLATVISAYRKIIDAYYNDSLSGELLSEMNVILGRVANRETDSHFFDKEADMTSQYYTGRQELSNQEFVAIINDYKDGKLVISQRNYFKIGDELEIFTPSGERYPYIVLKIYNLDNEEIEVARHPEEVLMLPFDKELEKFSMIRLKEKKNG